MITWSVQPNSFSMVNETSGSPGSSYIWDGSDSPVAVLRFPAPAFGSSKTQVQFVMDGKTALFKVLLTNTESAAK